MENIIRLSSQFLGDMHLFSSFIAQNEPPDKWKTLRGMVHIYLVTSIYYRVSSLRMNHLTRGKHEKRWFTYVCWYSSIIEFHRSEWSTWQVENTKTHGSHILGHIDLFSSFITQNDPPDKWKRLRGIVRIYLVTSMYCRVSSLKRYHLTSANHYKA